MQQSLTAWDATLRLLLQKVTKAKERAEEVCMVESINFVCLYDAVALWRNLCIDPFIIFYTDRAWLLDMRLHLWTNI